MEVELKPFVSYNKRQLERMLGDIGSSRSKTCWQMYEELKKHHEEERERRESLERMKEKFGFTDDEWEQYQKRRFY